MRTGLIQELRAILRGHPDGLTTVALADMTGRDRHNVRKLLIEMPDTYVDRWDGPHRGQYNAVWCVVIPPDNCPHPTRKVVAVRPRIRRDTREDERQADARYESND
jgi:hypothetical protein